MTWLDAGDRLAQKYVLDRLPKIGTGEPRSLRWFPLFILVAVTAGYALIVSFPGRSPYSNPLEGYRMAILVVASLLFFFGFSISNWIRFVGPRIGPRFEGDRLDEREMAIRDRAFALSGSFIAWCAVLGCFWIGVAPFVGGWRPHRLLDWIYLGMCLEAWVLTLPVLIASWLQPREAAEVA